MNDLFFFVALILAFFIMWVYSGGPNNPISFAGPYITPITNVGVQSVGYGDGGSTRSSDSSSWGRWTGSGNSDVQVIDSARSPYEGKVRISSSDPEATDERSEYISIRSDADDDVSITGWHLVLASSGLSETIPQGAKKSGSKRAITLEPGDEALIISGSRASDDLKGDEPHVWRAYLGTKDDIWPRGNDTITLLDANGKVVDQYHY